MNNKMQKFSQNDQQAGFTMIEVLVTIVVTGIGLLGLAAMQNTSLRYSYDSYLRTQSAFFANDLFDRMRANPTILYQDSSPTSVQCNLTTSNCAPAAMMQHDIRTWKARLNAAFPDVNTTITANTADPATANTYTISFKWDSRTTDGNNEATAGGTDNRQEFTYTARVK